MSLAFMAAGSAQARNHDAQRIDRQAPHALNHDRAAGPQEGVATPDRDAD